MKVVCLRLAKRLRLMLLATALIAITLIVGVLAFYQIQQMELVSFLRQYGAYNSSFKYTPLLVVDVDSIARPTGNLSTSPLVITYAFHQADNVDNVPYLWLTYVSGNSCDQSGKGSSQCHQMLLIIPDNNVTLPGKEPPLYAHPLNSYGFELYTASGEHIEWHLYLFLVTDS